MKFPHFALVILVGISPWVLQVRGSIQQGIESDIAKADILYYQGRFTEALTLLNELDGQTNAKNASFENLSKVKLLFGLTEVALGNTDQARKYFLDFCVLDPNYVLDEQQYPRKVVTLFKEAQQDCSKCIQTCSHAESLVASGDIQGAADLKTETETCDCASRAQARDQAALRHGRDLLSQGKYPEALKEFKDVLAAVPASEARLEAVATAQAKINSTVDSGVTEWREQFFSRNFERAAAAYNRIRSLAEYSTGSVHEEVSQIAARYQSTFQDINKSWDTACSRNDQVAMKTIRAWAQSLDPDRSIQPSALDRMGECTNPPAPNGKGAK